MSSTTFGFRNAVRVMVAFVPLVALEGYWATYSAGLVNATSMDSIWPPIHVLFTLALLAGLFVPVHRGVQAGQRWAYILAAAILWSVLIGSLSGLVSFWTQHPFGEAFVGTAATVLSFLLWFPYVAALRRIRPFDERELLALYVLLTTGALIMGFGAAHFLFAALMAPRYYATDSNHWEEQIVPHLPKLLFPPDTETAKDFYIGHRSPVPWDLWAGPLALWTVYVVLVCVVMLGINGLIRKLWIHNERLTFPQVYLPLEMARQEEGFLNRFFRSKTMWAGFALAAGLETIVGIHVYFPQTPTIQIRSINLMAGVTAPPWSSIGGLSINIYPCIIGLTFFLTSEVSWSVWVFYLVRKLLPVLGYQVGWQEITTQNGTRFPFPDQVSTGAFLGVGLIALYSIFKLWRGAKSRGEDLAIPPREIIAVVGGMALLLLWTRLLGMSLTVAFAFLVGMLLASLAYTRVRAETGLGGLTGPMPPQDAIVESVGPTSFTPRDLNGLGSMRWSCWDLRFLPSEMPAQLEGYKIGNASGIPDRFLFWGLILSVVIGLVISYAIELPVIYNYGAGQMNPMRYNQTPQDTLKSVSRWITSAKGSDTLGVSAGSFGLAITCLLAFLRAQFLSFPLHPLGFAIGFSRRTVEWMWASILIGWALKALTLRIGGLEAYRKLLPFFMGLLLGDFFACGIFGLLGCIFPETAGYQVYP